MKRPLTLEEKIIREFWQQGRDASDMREETFHTVPRETLDVIWRTWHSAQELRVEVELAKLSRGF